MVTKLYNAKAKLLVMSLALALLVGYFVFAAPVPAQAADKFEGMTLAEVQQQILKETNAYRKSKGVKALKLSTKMNTVAVNWSKSQAKSKKMSHNPKYSSQIPKGWTAAGENVAYGYAPKAVTKAWWNSPGHKANMLNKKYNYIGIGIAKDSSGRFYYTQVFGAYSKTP